MITPVSDFLKPDGFTPQIFLRLLAGKYFWPSDFRAPQFSSEYVLLQLHLADGTSILRCSSLERFP